jgi:hypothetical protein
MSSLRSFSFEESTKEFLLNIAKISLAGSLIS